MLLSEILYNIPLKSVSGRTDINVLKIEFDSRKIEEGTLFVAIPGTQVDGHNFIEKAIETGEGQIVKLKSFGVDEVGEQVSVYEFEWSIKLKSIKK